MKKSKKSSRFMNVFLCILGVAFLIWGASNIILGFVGERDTAIITNIRREGGRLKGTEPGKYLYNISYSFKLSNGKIVDGFTKRVSQGVYVKSSNSTTYVRYFKFFPYVNALEEDTKSFGKQLLVAFVGVFLIFVVKKSSFKDNN